YHCGWRRRMNVFLTGGTGFVGRAVVTSLLNHSHHVTAAVRSTSSSVDRRAKQVVVPDINSSTDWVESLAGQDVIIHSAARVHVMSDAASDPLAEFRRINMDGTLNFARQAAAAGVKRFIFISSIKVNGEGTLLGSPYTAFDIPAPQDPYGISKMEAETGLCQIAEDTGMEVVIIRPVLVYGPGVKANFRSMMSWLNKRLPLPLGAVHNKRSLVSLDNLVDLI